MELEIKQDWFNFKNYNYKIYQSDQLIYTATSNRLIIPILRSITVSDNIGGNIYTIKQKNFIKHILSLVPVINLLFITSCPYIIYKNNKDIGVITEYYYFKGGTVKAVIEGIEYYLYCQTGNGVSIYCNDQQIGIIKRDVWKHGDADTYHVLFDSCLKPIIAALLSVMIDILWHTSDTKFSSISYEYTIQFGQKETDKNWHPKN